jgi:predicted aspartyl protease
MLNFRRLRAANPRTHVFRFAAASMKRSQITGCLLLWMLLAGCATVPRPSRRDPYDPDCLLGSGSVTVPLINQRNYQWQVRAEVNGVSGVFILDTGAEHTLITPQFARQTGLWEASSEGRLLDGNGGPGKVRFARLSVLRLGDAAYLRFYVPIIDLDHIQRALNTEIDGILGNNVLDKTAFEIDGRRNLLTLQARSSTPPPKSIPITVRRGHLYVQARINGRTAEFALDTGAYRSTLAVRELRRLQIPSSKQTQTEAPKIDINTAEILKLTDAQVDSFEAGPILRTNYSLRVWNHNALGMDLLTPWVITVDARQGWMSLVKPATPEGE